MARLQTREREVEGRTAVRFRVRPDLAAVLADDPLHDGEAHARAFELRGPMQALEDPEQFIGILHVETDAVVAHVYGTLLRLVANIDDRTRLLACVLERIADQILEHLLHETGIALDLR